MLRLRKKLDASPGAPHDGSPPSSMLDIADGLATDAQKVNVYMVINEGAYLFDPQRNLRSPITSEDFRTLGFALDRPSIPPGALIQLVFVADDGYGESSEQAHQVAASCSGADTGTIAANVYLLAASRGLACWIDDCDPVALAQRLKLSRAQRILFVQTLGYPADWESAACSTERPTTRVTE